MTDIVTLSDRAALIDALRMAIKNSNERSSSGMTFTDFYSNVEVRLMLQKIDAGADCSNKEIRAALDELLR